MNLDKIIVYSIIALVPLNNLYMAYSKIGRWSCVLALANVLVNIWLLNSPFMKSFFILKGKSFMGKALRLILPVMNILSALMVKSVQGWVSAMPLMAIYLYRNFNDE